MRNALLLLKKPVGWLVGGAKWGNMRAFGAKLIATDTLFVGTSGFLNGYRPADHPTSSFGDINPKYYAGLRIFQLTANSSNNIVVLQFEGDAQVGLSTILNLTVDGVTAALTWTGVRYEATDIPLAAAIVNAAGTAVSYSITE